MTITPNNLKEAAEAIRNVAGGGLQALPVGLDSSAVEAPSDVVRISSRGLDKIASIEPGNLLAVVEAGLTAAEVDAALEPTGLYWPVTGLSGRTLGGIVNEGLLGVETMARGNPCDWILGATMIDASSRIVSSGGRTLKNVSGYDLTRLAWRSRGSLVMSASLILKLIPRPKSFPVLEWRLDGPAAAASQAERVILAKIRPEALRVAAEPGRVKIIVWLAGFPEMVAHQAERLTSILGRPDARREDGFGYFLDHFERWPQQSPEMTARTGTRREILDFLRKLHAPSEPPDSWRFDLDVGGGRAHLGAAMEPSAGILRPAAAVSDPSNLVRRLKSALDPGNVFWPLSPERDRS